MIVYRVYITIMIRENVIIETAHLDKRPQIFVATGCLQNVTITSYAKFSVMLLVGSVSISSDGLRLK